MTQRILLLASHAVAEFDDLRMFTDLGYDVFAPGGYEVPFQSGEGIRPTLPDAPYHPELVEAVNSVRAAKGEPGPAIDWGKASLHDDVVDWADVIICHHFPDRWLTGQWERIAHKRVIWRTCGQSDPDLEQRMSFLRVRGLQIVRYSPKEREFFEPLGWAGEDTVIRFGKYPEDYGPWRGWGGMGPEGLAYVGNVTQQMPQRGDSCGYSYWREATEGLPVAPAGEGSELMRNGQGKLTYEQMLDYLRAIRVYLYTGTRPASYTLGLIEAMLSGVPVVAMGPGHFIPPGLYEGHEIAGIWADQPSEARAILGTYLAEPELARYVGSEARKRAIELFDVRKIGRQWVDFLGAPTTVTYEKGTSA